MNENVKAKCDLLISNRALIEKEFKWGSSLMNIAAALIFTGEGRAVEIERLKECKEILAKSAGVFSGLRSTAEPIVVCKMALANDPIQYVNDLKMVYDKLAKKFFSDSGYLVQAAISIIEADRLHDVDSQIDRFKALYKQMGKVHPLLTSSEDIIFGMFLSLTGKTNDEIIRDMEICYDYLKKERKIKISANEIQGLSELVALNNDDLRARCDKAVEIYETFKAHGAKYGAEYNEFASLATLVDIDVDKDALVDEIIEVEAYLKGAKGFGSWTMDKKQRLVFAAMLVGETYSSDKNVSNFSAINSSIAVTVAEEIALMMCVMLTTTANVNN